MLDIMMGHYKLQPNILLVELENTAAYNTFTNSDLGSVMTGYYLEGGYNLFVDKNMQMVN